MSYSHDTHVGCEKLEVQTENAKKLSWEKWWFKANTFALLH